MSSKSKYALSQTGTHAPTPSACLRVLIRLLAPLVLGRAAALLLLLRQLAALVGLLALLAALLRGVLSAGARRGGGVDGLGVAEVPAPLREAVGQQLAQAELEEAQPEVVAEAQLRRACGEAERDDGLVAREEVDLEQVLPPGDAGEMQRRCRGDAGEMQGRCRGDVVVRVRDRVRDRVRVRVRVRDG